MIVNAPWQRDNECVLSNGYVTDGDYATGVCSCTHEAKSMAWL